MTGSGDYAYKTTEVSGEKNAAELQRINGLFGRAAFFPLKDRDFLNGYWWITRRGDEVAAFAGMVPWEPFPRVGYLKRTGTLPGHRGNGLQLLLMRSCEERARASTDWTHMVSETAIDNPSSSNNFIRAGYRLMPVTRPWAKDTLVWRKALHEEER